MIYRYITLLVLLFPFLNELSHAEDPAPGETTELLIQGSTFERRLHDLSASATVIDPNVSGTAQNTSFQDVIDLIPNLNYAAGTARPRFFQIRGIGELEQYSGAPNPSVGVIVDDLDFSGLGLFSSLFDTEQVEVFRGPQATRFGSSALAGVINYKSQDPTRFYEMHSTLSSGSDELKEGAIALSGPFSESNKDLQFRFAISKHNSDGFRENVFFNSDDTNKRDELTSRLKLRYEPSQSFRVDIIGLYVDNDDGYDVFTIDNSLTTQSDRPGVDKIQANAGAIKIRVQPTKSIEIVNTATRYITNQDYSFDGDWGNNPFWGEFAPYDFFEADTRDRSVYSDELRISSYTPDYMHGETYRWLVGGFGQSLREGSTINQFSDGESFSDLASTYRAQTGALFAEGEIPLGSGTSFTANSRIEYRDASYNDSNFVLLEPNDWMWGGSLALAHDLAEHKRIYASFARGFKGGGVNPGIRVPDDSRIYDPESQYSFELGLKAEWFQRKLQTNLAFFHALRRNAQLKFAFQDDPSDPLSFTYVTESEGRGQSTGAELELRYNITPNFALFSSAGLLDSEYTSVPEENGTLDGRDYSHAPNWQYVFGTEQNFTQGFFLREEISGKDAFYFDDSNSERSSVYHLVGFSAGIKQENFSLTFWGRNIFDKDYATRGFFFGNEPPDFPNKRYIQRGDPAQFGVTLTVRFD